MHQKSIFWRQNFNNLFSARNFAWCIPRWIGYLLNPAQRLSIVTHKQILWSNVHLLFKHHDLVIRAWCCKLDRSEAKECWFLNWRDPIFISVVPPYILVSAWSPSSWPHHLFAWLLQMDSEPLAWKNSAFTYSVCTAATSTVMQRCGTEAVSALRCTKDRSLCMWGCAGGWETVHAFMFWKGKKKSFNKAIEIWCHSDPFFAHFNFMNL